MGCTYGTISKVFAIGINPQGMEDKTTCNNIEANKKCYDALNQNYINSIINELENGATKTGDF